MSFRYVALKDCCEIVSGATPSRTSPEYWENGDISWVTPKDLSNLDTKYLSETPEHITELGLKSCSAKILPANSVLLSSRAPIGHLAINTIPMCTNQGFKSLVPSNDVLPEYLYYCLSYNKARLQDLGVGATFKEISKRIVESIKIPLPPLETQKKIAAVLDKADRIRQLRKQALQRLDDLIQSVFLDMFGDPVTNPKGWEKVELGKVNRVVTGNTPPTKETSYYGDYLEWIKSDNLNSSLHIATRAEKHLSAKGVAVGRTVPQGSILMTCIAGSPSCIGNVAIVDRKVSFNQQINGIVPGDCYVSEFLYSCLLLSKSYIQHESTNSMKGMISKGNLAKIPFICPPYQLQMKFKDIFMKVFSGTSLSNSHASHTDDLFNAIQHGLFSV